MTIFGSLWWAPPAIFLMIVALVLGAWITVRRAAHQTQNSIFSLMGVLLAAAAALYPSASKPSETPITLSRACLIIILVTIIVMSVGLITRATKKT